MSALSVGVPSRPVIFAEGQPLPPAPRLGIYAPQNVWHTLEGAQDWAANAVLDLDGSQPYKELPGKPVADKIAEADKRRANDEVYSDRRSLSDFGALFEVSDGMLAAEFAGRQVLDIGSGAGVLSEDLRTRAGAARVTEVDFSEQALRAGNASPNRQRVMSDGTRLGLASASADRTISMFSTVSHSETVDKHLRAICEAIRVTKVGGRVFLAPLVVGMNMRSKSWHLMQTYAERYQTPEDFALRRKLQQQAARDFAAIGLLRGLMKDGFVSFTPTLKIEKVQGYNRDIMAAMLDVHKPFSAGEAATRMAPYVAQFSPSA